MKRYSLTHLGDRVLLRNLADLVARERANTADLIAHIAEVDARRLYLPAAHSSMFSYCVRVLGLSEDAAFRRIRAARAARRYPRLFPAIADGRLSLTAVVLLKPHLRPENLAELVEAATHKTKAEVEKLLARRFPVPDLPARVRPLGPASIGEPGGVDAPALDPTGPFGVAALDLTGQLVPEPVTSVCSQVLTATELVPEPVANAYSQALAGRAPVPEPLVIEPLVPSIPPASPARERYSLQLTMRQETHAKLRYAQELLGHSIPSGDLAQVLEAALDALIAKLEKSRFAATDRPRERLKHDRPRTRYVPSSIKREVWSRDAGRCTFVSEDGHRCDSRKFLEFDHVLEFARGGPTTAANLRLRCRQHNQMTAECAFGEEFMQSRRAGNR